MELGENSVMLCVLVFDFHLSSPFNVYSRLLHSPSFQCNTAGLSLTEELLYVHKAQAVIEFCGECKKLLKAFKLEVNTPEGN